MSISNFFLCCHPNDVLIQASALGLGIYLSYAYNKKLIEPTKIPAVIDAKTKQPIGVNEPPIGNSPTRISPEPLSSPPIREPIFLENLIRGTIRYSGAVFTLVLVGANLYYVRTGTFQTLRYLNDAIGLGNRNNGPVSLESINNSINSVRDIADSANNVIQDIRYKLQHNGNIEPNQKLELDKLGSDITEKLGKLENEMELNRQQAKDIIDILRAIREQIEKLGGDTKKIDENIKSAAIFLGKEQYFVMKPNTKPNVIFQDIEQGARTREGSNIQTMEIIKQGEEKIENIISDNLLPESSPITIKSGEIVNKGKISYENLDPKEIQEIKEQQKRARETWRNKFKEIIKKLPKPIQKEFNEIDIKALELEKEKEQTLYGQEVKVETEIDLRLIDELLLGNFIERIEKLIEQINKNKSQFNLFMYRAGGVSSPSDLLNALNTLRAGLYDGDIRELFVPSSFLFYFYNKGEALQAAKKRTGDENALQLTESDVFEASERHRDESSKIVRELMKIYYEYVKIYSRYT